MPVEFHILTGSLQGAVVRSDSDRVVINDDASPIQLRFPEDPCAASRKVCVSLDAGGWKIENTGVGYVFLNQSPVSSGKSARVRAGDVIRLSEEGPDIEFEIVSKVGTTAPALPSPSVIPPEPSNSAHDTNDAPKQLFSSGHLALGSMLAVACVAIISIIYVSRAATQVPIVQPMVTPVTVEKAPSPSPPMAVAQVPASETAPATTSDSPRTEASPVKPAPVETASRQTSRPLSIDEVRNAVSGATVWLGAELRGRKYPLCTGWAIRRNFVVSTAREISELKKYHDQGAKVFVFCATETDPFFGVQRLELHSSYLPDEPGDPRSLAYNVGVVQLSRELPDACQMATAADLRRDGTEVVGMEIVVLGYGIPYSPEYYRSYDSLNAPKLLAKQGTIRTTEVTSGAQDDLPNLVLSVDWFDGADGSPIVDRGGKVVGIVFGSQKVMYGTLIDRLLPLIP
jgi:hypothetical protein